MLQGFEYTSTSSEIEFRLLCTVFVQLKFIFFFPDFEYVVKQTEKAKICFGMTSERNTLPLESKFMNTFMRRNTKDVNPNIGPYTYKQDRSGALYDLKTKVKSINIFIYEVIANSVSLLIFSKYISAG